MTTRGISIALACRTFGISETCFRYSPKRDDENEMIADLLVGLTNVHKTWGFGLCFLHLRNVKGHVWNHNRTVRHEWLDLYILETIEEVQEIATEWLWTYNHERPNMGIGGVTPVMKLKWPREFYGCAPLKRGGLPGRRWL